MSKLQPPLQAILDMSSSNIAVLDESGLVIATNLAWKNFARDHHLQNSIYWEHGWNYLELCESVSGSSAQEARSVAQGIRQVIKRQHDKFCWQYSFDDSGRQSWFAMSVIRIEDTHGAKVVIEHKNITSDQHHHSLALFQSCIEQTTEMVLITDKKGAIEYVNPAFEQISGYSKQEVLGKNPRLLKSGLHDLDFYNKLWKTIFSGNSFTSEVINRKKNGELYWEEKIITPLKNQNGQITHFVSTSRDITERMKMKEKMVIQEKQIIAQQRLAALGQMASGISHDFRNIIQIVSAYAEALLNDYQSFPQQAKEDLAVILGEGNKAQLLIQRILDFGRKSESTKQCLEVKSVVGEIVKLLQRILPKTIQIKFETEPDKKYFVYGDATQIQQIVTNLAINARDAMHEGGILKIALRKLATKSERQSISFDIPSSKWLLISVTDVGKGIEQDLVPHIFEPYFTNKKFGEGTGLGLAQVYGLVKQHQGFIKVESEVEKGTTFLVFFPLLEKTVPSN